MDRWHFFYHSADFSGGNTQGYYGFFNPYTHQMPSNWKKFTDGSLWPTSAFEEDIMLSFGVFDSNYMLSYPCVSFSGAYAAPVFVKDPNVVYQSLGLYQGRSHNRISLYLNFIPLLAHVIILYVFDEKDNGAILDRSGNSFDGVWGKIFP